MIFLATAQEQHPRQLQTKHPYQLKQLWKQLGGLMLQHFKNITISH